MLSYYKSLLLVSVLVKGKYYLGNIIIRMLLIALFYSDVAWVTGHIVFLPWWGGGLAH